MRIHLSLLMADRHDHFLTHTDTDSQVAQHRAAEGLAANR
jgi:hypothetical protein